MSARIVLLSFSDNQAAEEFCRLLAKGQDEENIVSGQEAEDNDLAMAGILLAYSKLEAMVARPSVWCRCRKGLSVRSQQYRAGAGWKKSKRFGWWVHARCNMPSKAAVMYFVDHMLNGCRDLLPELFGQPDRPLVRDYKDVPDGPFDPRFSVNSEPESRASGVPDVVQSNTSAPNGPLSG